MRIRRMVTFCKLTGRPSAQSNPSRFPRFLRLSSITKLQVTHAVFSPVFNVPRLVSQVDLFNIMVELSKYSGDYFGMGTAADYQDAVRVSSLGECLGAHIFFTLTVAPSFLDFRQVASIIGVASWYLTILPFLWRHLNVSVVAVLKSA